jgi:hypothetical protein
MKTHITISEKFSLTVYIPYRWEGSFGSVLAGSRHLVRG